MDLENSLASKVAMVTGAASGIGRETSLAFARHGAKVAAVDANLVGAKETAQEINQTHGSAIAIPLDVADEAKWPAVIKKVEDELGGFDVLVNGAGIELVKMIAETSLEDFRRVTSVNLDGVFLGTKYALATMAARSGGSIINISSIAGILGMPRQTAYCASKGGVRLLTKAAAMEAAHLRANVRVNSVHPGAIDTPMVAEMVENMPHTNEAARASLANWHPLGRLGRPSDIASAILFLASDHSSFMTGAELVIDGGVTAQ